MKIITKQLEQAPRSFTVEIKDDQGMLVYRGEMTLRQYSTGSWGYYNAGKCEIPNTQGERGQVGCQITVIGSKHWPAIHDTET